MNLKAGFDWLLALIGLGPSAGKLGGAASSFVSFALYAAMFDWKIATVVVLAILVHELGHAWAMRRCGMRVGGIRFIPVLGAVTVSEDIPPTRVDGVWVAVMGPLWGLFSALAAVSAYLVTEESFFASAAGFIAFMNLFNLLPVIPLDGGTVLRNITASVQSRAAHVVLDIGILAIAVVANWQGLNLFLLILPIVAYQRIGEMKRPSPAPGMERTDTVVVAIVYVLLAAWLWAIVRLMEHMEGPDIIESLFKG